MGHVVDPSATRLGRHRPVGDAAERIATALERIADALESLPDGASTTKKPRRKLAEPTPLDRERAARVAKKFGMVAKR